MLHEVGFKTALGKLAPAERAREGAPLIGNRLGLRLRDRDSACTQRQAHSKAPANNPQHVTKAPKHPNAAWFV